MGAERWDGLVVGPTLVTLAGDAGYGAIADGALGWKDGVLTHVGTARELPDAPEALAHEVIRSDGCITPGLVDCHTHLVFAGNRAGEFEQRLEGASYEDIARSGGGIVSSVRAVRAASEDALLAESLPRARALVADGVTTLEVKSGYGLDFDSERRMLRVARRLGDVLGVTVRTTYLAAHALPPEYAGRADAYIDATIDWLPRLHAEGLVDAVDAFAERIGFDAAQTRRLFEAARALGLPVKLHADQLSDGEGAALVAEFGGLSADHVEHTSAAGVTAMAAAGTLTLAEAVRPALEAATRSMGAGVLSTAEERSAGEVLAGGDITLFALAADEVQAWFGIRPLSNPAPTEQGPLEPGSMRVLYDVELSLTAEIGRTRMPLRDVLGLTPGTVLELDRAAGSPADVMINGRLVARGDIVVVDEDYAVRITEIVSETAGQ